MNKSDKIFIAGHRGMVGSALLRLFKKSGYENIVTAEKSELDLTDQKMTADFFDAVRPAHVILAAAKVGGIQANRKYPAEFLYENLVIQNNVIHQCYEKNARTIVFLGSSCIYPRECPQPIREEYLLTGPLEPTNEGYALAKIAGLRMAQYYSKEYGIRAVNPMPCNLYGTNDSFDPEKSHVLSALVKKLVDARDAKTPVVTMWGSGIARREFMHVDDLARAVIFLIFNYGSSEIINVGSGYDISIRELAEKIALKTGYDGKMKWDTSMPDGMLRKCLDVSKLKALGFEPSISLDAGIDEMITEYKKIKSNKGEVQ